MTDDRRTVWLRRVARVWSALVILIALMVLIGNIVAPEETAADYPPAENLMPLAMGVSVLGLALAYRWELLGGLVNVLFWLLNVLLYWIIRGYFFPLGALLALSPVMIPGVLFLICWWRERPRASQRTPPRGTFGPL